ncbi:2-hydroxymuconate tautomerase [Roseococcus sp.]|uniref:2-hydroxymuconate tautomerase n=1 Tax=Roseococcus sp. TaxID=2109646 RepID=UPI003BAA3F79
MEIERAHLAGGGAIFDGSAAPSRRNRMPMIRVEMYAGRSPEQKKALVKALTEAFVATAGSTPDSVQIVLQDIEKSDWATGGVLASDKA